MSQLTYKTNTLKALSFLVIPFIILTISILLFRMDNTISYCFATILLSLFFTQTFILLHECGHLNFFVSKLSNNLFGHLFGFLTGIPFIAWKHMHNLHHKWTGWRDLDPTTEKTVDIGKSIILKQIVNVCWFLFIPLFYISYFLSNYWNIFKIKRFLSERNFKLAFINIILLLAIYVFLIVFYTSFLFKYIFPAFFLSFIWKELIIMTQHSHIEIPISEGSIVQPISYKEQVKYSRSFYTNKFISKYFLFNFNLHEAHHLQPGLPAYWLDKLEINSTKKTTYFEWFKKAKSLKGENYIFRTSKHTGKEI